MLNTTSTSFEEKLHSKPQFWAFHLDPRTKMLLILGFGICVIGNGPYETTLFAFVVSLVLGIGVLTRRFIVGYTVAFMLLSAVFYIFPQVFTSTGLILLVGVCFWLSRFLVLAGLGAYVLSSTTAGEFAAALSALHFPRALIISFSVVFRFIPITVAELKAVIEAMRLRGVVSGGRDLLLHPLRVTEYILVPLLASAAIKADNLAASGTIRGLGADVRRTCVIPLGLSLGDILGWAALVIVFCFRLGLVSPYFEGLL